MSEFLESVARSEDSYADVAFGRSRSRGTSPCPQSPEPPYIESKRSPTPKKTTARAQERVSSRSPSLRQIQFHRAPLTLRPMSLSPSPQHRNRAECGSTSVRRSPSPMWVPGGDSFAAICQRAQDPPVIRVNSFQPNLHSDEIELPPKLKSVKTDNEVAETPCEAEQRKTPTRDTSVFVHPTIPGLVIQINEPSPAVQKSKHHHRKRRSKSSSSLSQSPSFTSAATDLFFPPAQTNAFYTSAQPEACSTAAQTDESFTAAQAASMSPSSQMAAKKKTNANKASNSNKNASSTESSTISRGRKKKAKEKVVESREKEHGSSQNVQTLPIPGSPCEDEMQESVGIGHVFCSVDGGDLGEKVKTHDENDVWADEGSGSSHELKFKISKEQTNRDLEQTINIQHPHEVPSQKQINQTTHSDLGLCGIKAEEDKLLEIDSLAAEGSSTVVLNGAENLEGNLASLERVTVSLLDDKVSLPLDSQIAFEVSDFEDDRECENEFEKDAKFGESQQKSDKQMEICEPAQNLSVFAGIQEGQLEVEQEMEIGETQDEFPEEKDFCENQHDSVKQEVDEIQAPQELMEKNGFCENQHEVEKQLEVDEIPTPHECIEKKEFCESQHQFHEQVVVDEAQIQEKFKDEVEDVKNQPEFLEEMEFRDSHGEFQKEIEIDEAQTQPEREEKVEGQPQHEFAVEMTFVESLPEVEKEWKFVEGQPEFEKESEFVDSEPEFEEKSEFVQIQPEFEKEWKFVESQPEFEKKSECAESQPEFEKESEFVESQPEFESESEYFVVVEENGVNGNVNSKGLTVRDWSGSRSRSRSESGSASKNDAQPLLLQCCLLEGLPSYSHLIDLNEAERRWREKLAKRRKSLNSNSDAVDKGYDGSDDGDSGGTRKPENENDDRSSRWSESELLGGSSGPAPFGSFCVDWSTKLSSADPVSPLPKLKLQETKSEAATPQFLSEVKPLANSSLNYHTDEHQPPDSAGTRKEHSRQSVKILEDTLAVSEQKLAVVANVEDVELARAGTQELVGTVATLEASLSTLMQILGGIPMDVEVLELANDTKEISFRIRALKLATKKLQDELKTGRIQSFDPPPVMTKVESSTFEIPRVQVVSEVTDGDGSKFLTKFERSGFVSSRTAVSVTQSLKEKPVDDATTDHSSPSADSVLLRMSQAETPQRSPSDFTDIPEDLSERLSMMPFLPTQSTDAEVTLSVRQTTQNVTRRIIRKRRRIVRRTMIINGVETTQEEVIEEPDEVAEETQHFSSGPVVDVVGRRAVDSERPMSPGVVISEITEDTGEPVGAIIETGLSSSGRSSPVTPTGNRAFQSSSRFGNYVSSASVTVFAQQTQEKLEFMSPSPYNEAVDDHKMQIQPTGESENENASIPSEAPTPPKRKPHKVTTKIQIGSDTHPEESEIRVLDHTTKREIRIGGVSDTSEQKVLTEPTHLQTFTLERSPPVSEKDELSPPVISTYELKLGSDVDEDESSPVQSETPESSTSPIPPERLRRSKSPTPPTRSGRHAKIIKALQTTLSPSPSHVSPADQHDSFTSSVTSSSFSSSYTSSDGQVTTESHRVFEETENADFEIPDFDTIKKCIMSTLIDEPDLSDDESTSSSSMTLMQRKIVESRSSRIEETSPTGLVASTFQHTQQSEYTTSSSELSFPEISAKDSQTETSSVELHVFETSESQAKKDSIVDSEHRTSDGGTRTTKAELQATIGNAQEQNQEGAREKLPMVPVPQTLETSAGMDSNAEISHETLEVPATMSKDIHDEHRKESTATVPGFVLPEVAESDSPKDSTEQFDSVSSEQEAPLTTMDVHTYPQSPESDADKDSRVLGKETVSREPKQVEHEIVTAEQNRSQENIDDRFPGTREAQEQESEKHSSAKPEEHMLSERESLAASLGTDAQEQNRDQTRLTVENATVVSSGPTEFPTSRSVSDADLNQGEGSNRLAGVPESDSVNKSNLKPEHNLSGDSAKLPTIVETTAQYHIPEDSDVPLPEIPKSEPGTHSDATDEDNLHSRSFESPDVNDAYLPESNEKDTGSMPLGVVVIPEQKDAASEEEVSYAPAEFPTTTETDTQDKDRENTADIFPAPAVPVPETEKHPTVESKEEASSEPTVPPTPTFTSDEQIENQKETGDSAPLPAVPVVPDAHAAEEDRIVKQEKDISSEPTAISITRTNEQNDNQEAGQALPIVLVSPGHTHEKDHTGKNNGILGEPMELSAMTGIDTLDESQEQAENTLPEPAVTKVEAEKYPTVEEKRDMLQQPTEPVATTGATDIIEDNQQSGDTRPAPPTVPVVDAAEDHNLKQKGEIPSERMDTPTEKCSDKEEENPEAAAYTIPEPTVPQLEVAPASDASPASQINVSPEQEKISREPVVASGVEDIDEDDEIKERETAALPGSTVPAAPETETGIDLTLRRDYISSEPTKVSTVAGIDENEENKERKAYALPGATISAVAKSDARIDPTLKEDNISSEPEQFSTVTDIGEENENKERDVDAVTGAIVSAAPESDAGIDPSLKHEDVSAVPTKASTVTGIYGENKERDADALPRIAVPAVQESDAGIDPTLTKEDIPSEPTKISEVADICAYADKPDEHEKDASDTLSLPVLSVVPVSSALEAEIALQPTELLTEISADIQSENQEVGDILSRATNKDIPKTEIEEDSKVVNEEYISHPTTTIPTTDIHKENEIQEQSGDIAVPALLEPKIDAYKHIVDHRDTLLPSKELPTATCTYAQAEIQKQEDGTLSKDPFPGTSDSDSDKNSADEAQAELPVKPVEVVHPAGIDIGDLRYDEEAILFGVGVADYEVKHDLRVPIPQLADLASETDISDVANAPKVIGIPEMSSLASKNDSASTSSPHSAVAVRETRTAEPEVLDSTLEVDSAQEFQKKQVISTALVTLEDPAKVLESKPEVHSFDASRKSTETPSIVTAVLLSKLASDSSVRSKEAHRSPSPEVKVSEPAVFESKPKIDSSEEPQKSPSISTPEVKLLEPNTTDSKREMDLSDVTKVSAGVLVPQVPTTATEVLEAKLESYLSEVFMKPTAVLIEKCPAPEGKNDSSDASTKSSGVLVSRFPAAGADNEPLEEANLNSSAPIPEITALDPEVLKSESESRPSEASRKLSSPAIPKAPSATETESVETSYMTPVVESSEVLKNTLEDNPGDRMNADVTDANVDVEVAATADEVEKQSKQITGPSFIETKDDETTEMQSQRQETLDSSESIGDVKPVEEELEKTGAIDTSQSHVPEIPEIEIPEVVDSTPENDSSPTSSTLSGITAPEVPDSEPKNDLVGPKPLQEEVTSQTSRPGIPRRPARARIDSKGKSLPTSTDEPNNESKQSTASKSTGDTGSETHAFEFDQNEIEDSLESIVDVKSVREQPGEPVTPEINIPETSGTSAPASESKNKLSEAKNLTIPVVADSKPESGLSETSEQTSNSPAQDFLVTEPKNVSSDPKPTDTNVDEEEVQASRPGIPRRPARARIESQQSNLPRTTEKPKPPEQIPVTTPAPNTGDEVPKAASLQEQKIYDSSEPTNNAQCLQEKLQETVPVTSQIYAPGIPTDSISHPATSKLKDDFRQKPGIPIPEREAYLSQTSSKPSEAVEIQKVPDFQSEIDFPDLVGMEPDIEVVPQAPRPTIPCRPVRARIESKGTQPTTDQLKTESQLATVPILIGNTGQEPSEFQFPENDTSESIGDAECFQAKTEETLAQYIPESYAPEVPEIFNQEDETLGSYEAEVFDVTQPWSGTTLTPLELDMELARQALELKEIESTVFGVESILESLTPEDKLDMLNKIENDVKRFAPSAESHSLITRIRSEIEKIVADESTEQGYAECVTNLHKNFKTDEKPRKSASLHDLHLQIAKSKEKCKYLAQGLMTAELFFSALSPSSRETKSADHAKLMEGLTVLLENEAKEQIRLLHLAEKWEQIDTEITQDLHWFETSVGKLRKLSDLSSDEIPTYEVDYEKLNSELLTHQVLLEQLKASIDSISPSANCPELLTRLETLEKCHEAYAKRVRNGLASLKKFNQHFQKYTAATTQMKKTINEGETKLDEISVQPEINPAALSDLKTLYMKGQNQKEEACCQLEKVLSAIPVTNGEVLQQELNAFVERLSLLEVDLETEKLATKAVTPSDDELLSKVNALSQKVNDLMVTIESEEELLAYRDCLLALENELFQRKLELGQLDAKRHDAVDADVYGEISRIIRFLEAELLIEFEALERMRQKFKEIELLKTPLKQQQATLISEVDEIVNPQLQSIEGVEPTLQKINLLESELHDNEEGLAKLRSLVSETPASFTSHLHYNFPPSICVDEIATIADLLLRIEQSKTLLTHILELWEEYEQVESTLSAQLLQGNVVVRGLRTPPVQSADIQTRQDFLQKIKSEEEAAKVLMSKCESIAQEFQNVPIGSRAAENVKSQTQKLSENLQSLYQEVQNLELGYENAAALFQLFENQKLEAVERLNSAYEKYDSNDLYSVREELEIVEVTMEELEELVAKLELILVSKDKSVQETRLTFDLPFKSEVFALRDKLRELQQSCSDDMDLNALILDDSIEDDEVLSRFKVAQKALSNWLKSLEREKRYLDLPYLAVQRLPQVKQNIQFLLSRCSEGEELFKNFKRHAQEVIASTNDTPVKSNLTHELSSYNARLVNLQAALRTWLDHVNRLIHATQDFETRAAEMSFRIQSAMDRLAEVESPRDFAQLKASISKLKEIELESSSLNSLTEGLETIVDELKNTISPLDARVFSQRTWSLNNSHLELMSTISQRLAEAQEREDLVPRFDTKCKAWMVWADSVRDKLERPQFVDLNSYSRFLQTDMANDIRSKDVTYEWLLRTGEALSGMTSGKEQKELLKVMDQLKFKWKTLTETHSKKAAKAAQLQKTSEELYLKADIVTSLLKELEAFILSPVSFEEFSDLSLSQKVDELEREQMKLNALSTDVNDVLNVGNIAVSDFDDMRMTESGNLLLQRLDSLEKLWSGIIGQFKEREELLLALRDRLEKMCQDCTSLEESVGQLEEKIQHAMIPESQETQECVEALFQWMERRVSKVEDLRNDYFYLANKVDPSSCRPLSQRVKGILNRWREAVKQCRDLQVVQPLRSSLRESQANLDQIAAEANNLLSSKLRTGTNNAEQIESLLSSLNELPSADDWKPAIDEVGSIMPVSPVLAEVAEYEQKRKKLMSTLGARLAKIRQNEEKLSLKTELETKAVQVSTLSPEVTPDESPTSSLSSIVRGDVYKSELVKCVAEATLALDKLEGLLVDGSDLDHLAKAVGKADSTIEMCSYLQRLVIQDEETTTVDDLIVRFRTLEEKARAQSQSSQNGGARKDLKVTCPICSPTKRGAWECTLWRLEQWLQHSEGTLRERMKSRPPTELEALEDVILSHRELILDLDSHRALTSNLTSVLAHLEEHANEAVEVEGVDTADLENLRTRLAKALKWWKKVCHNCATWQARLQMALMENPDFHETVEEYETFLSQAQEVIRDLEPVNLAAPKHVLESKQRHFQELNERLCRTEPGLRTLKQTTEQLFVNPKAIEQEGRVVPSADSGERVATIPESGDMLDRIVNLNSQLRIQKRLLDAYMSFIGDVFEAEEPGSDDRFLTLSDQITARSGSSSPARSFSPTSTQSGAQEDDRRAAPASNRRGVGYVYRAFRASIPFQALVLLLLGTAVLLPFTEQDFSCFSYNSFAASLDPMLGYPNGPPRI